MPAPSSTRARTAAIAPRCCTAPNCQTSRAERASRSSETAADPRASRAARAGAASAGTANGRRLIKAGLRHQHVLFFVQPREAEARRRQARARDHARELTAQDARQKIRGVAEVQVQAPFGVALLELPQAPAPPSSGRARSACRASSSNGTCSSLEHDGAAALGFVQAAPRLWQEPFAGRRQRHLARRALEQAARPAPLRAARIRSPNAAGDSAQALAATRNDKLRRRVHEATQGFEIERVGRYVHASHATRALPCP